MNSLLTRARRRAVRQFRGEQPPRLAPNYYPDWRQLLAGDRSRWQKALNKAHGGPKVLVATGVGGHVPVVTLDSLIAVALTLRGADVELLLCDHALPACELIEANTYPDVEGLAERGIAQATCDLCQAPADVTYRSLGLRVRHYSDALEDGERQLASALAQSIPFNEISSFEWDGLPIGEHAFAGALRFFARGTLEAESFGEAILRRYVQAAILTAIVLKKMMRLRPYVAATFHHGIYVPQGVVGAVARAMNVRVVNYSWAHRKGSFFFSQRDTYHHTLTTEPTDLWENMPWTEEMEREIMTFLRARANGRESWIYFYSEPPRSVDAWAQANGVDPDRPWIGMLTNVMWDAQLHYRANAFRTMLEWTIETIRYFSRRPDLQLIIRIHPAEIRGTVPSRQPLLKEIGSVFPVLPPNVFLVPPESELTSYDLMARCNAGLIFATNMGIELAAMGIPMIVGGEARIRNKGFAYDATSPEDYFRILDQLPFARGMDERATRRARMYAYHFFFRRMIPLRAIQPMDGWPPFKIRPLRLSELGPGVDPGLDLVCEGILNGRDFIYPAESYSIRHEES